MSTSEQHLDSTPADTDRHDVDQAYDTDKGYDAGQAYDADKGDADKGYDAGAAGDQTFDTDRSRTLEQDDRYAHERPVADETTPVDSTPVDSTPVDSTPADTTPVADTAAADTTATAPTTEPSAPATTTAGTDSEDRERLVSVDRADSYGSRWNEVKGMFVDEPRQAVAQADTLVGELLEELEQLFREQRRNIEQGLDTDETSTEDLRLALRRYRSFFDRLLSL